MTLNDYQEQQQTTAIYPNIGDNMYYPALGLCGEAGEIANKIKKIYRDDNGIASDEAKKEIAKELGDVLWYLSSCASEIGFDLETIGKMNIEKLLSRKARNTISGNGDNR